MPVMPGAQVGVPEQRGAVQADHRQGGQRKRLVEGAEVAAALGLRRLELIIRPSEDRGAGQQQRRARRRRGW